MDQDTVQINAPDYDPDKDGPQPPRRHVNTAVVSVQDHFTPLESEILDVAESQAEDYTVEESTDTIYHNSEDARSLFLFLWLCMLWVLGCIVAFNCIGKCCESIPWNHTGSYVLPLYG